MSAWHEGIELEGIEKPEPTPGSTEERDRFRDVIAAYLEDIAEASRAGDVGETTLRAVKLTIELMVCISADKPDPTRAAIEGAGLLARALINGTADRVAQMQKPKDFKMDVSTIKK